MPYSRFKYVLFLALMTTAILVSGCKSNGMVSLGMPDDPGEANSEGVFGLMTLGGVFSGSGIQWNEDYYITARHIPMRAPSSHTCNCDLKFIKREARAPVPQWREAIPGEEIIALGYSNKIPFSSRGNILDFSIIVSNKYPPKGKELFRHQTLSGFPDQIVYRAHNAPIMSGMSGGAVISVQTGEILGMNISLTKRNRAREINRMKELGEGDPISIFIPFSMIQASWDNYQRMGQGELRWQLPGQEPLRRVMTSSPP